jgi:hypothetical protein
MVRRTRGVLTGLALALAGCGSPGGDSGGTVPTTVSHNKRIIDLTPAERATLCADVMAWAMSGPVLTDGCNASAWRTTSFVASADTSATDAALRGICQSDYDLCVASGVPPGCYQVPATCTATVSEFNMCLSDTVDAYGVLPPCSSVTRASLGTTLAILASQPISAECMSVEAKCPGAI